MRVGGAGVWRQAVAGEHGASGGDHRDVARLGQFLVGALEDLLEPGQGLVVLLLRAALGALQLHLQDLGALGLSCCRGVARGHRLLRGLAGAGGAGSGQIRAQVAHGLRGHDLLSGLASGTGQGSRRAGCLGHGLEFGCDEPRAGVVGQGLVGCLGHRFRRRDVAVALKHALVGHAVDHTGLRLSVQQLGDQLAPGAEAEHLGHGVWVQASVGQHAILAVAQLAPLDTGAQLALRVHALQLGDVQLRGLGDLDLDLRTILVGEAAELQELHGLVDRLLVHLRGDLVAHGLAQRLGGLLQLLELAASGVVQPLQIAQRAGLQLLDGLGLLLLQRGLVLGPRLWLHPGVFSAPEQRLELTHGLRRGDGLVGGDHPVEDSSHLRVQTRALVGGEHLLQAAVDADQPGAEAAEHALQLCARGLALEQVLLERLGNRLVRFSARVERLSQPLSRGAGVADVIEQRLHVGDDLCRRIGLRGERGLHLEEEVPGLVQEAREVRLLQQRDIQRAGVECGAGLAGLVEDVRVGRVEAAGVAGGGLDLGRLEGDDLADAILVAHDHTVVTEIPDGLVELAAFVWIAEGVGVAARAIPLDAHLSQRGSGSVGALAVIGHIPDEGILQGKVGLKDRAVPLP